MTPRSVIENLPEWADSDRQNEVWALLRAVDDPEYPGVSIVDLGLVENVRVDATSLQVDLVPTFSGCPALRMIEADVRRALVGFDDVVVRFVAAPAWTPARIAPAARAALATSYGVTVPVPGRAAACPQCGAAALVEQSAFGPVRCRSIQRCRACGEIVEAFR